MKVFYVAYHTLVQLQVFAHNNHIPLSSIRAVVDPSDLRGIHHEAVVLLLPGYWTDRRKRETVEGWALAGGRIQSLAEEVVLGDRPLVLGGQEKAPTP